MSPARPRHFAVVLGACLLVLGAGCSSDPRSGYAIGTTFDESIETIHIPVFSNDTFTRDVELLLTDAVIKEVQARTPWRVTSAEYAQVTLEAEVTEVELRKLSTAQISGLVQEQGVVMTVAFDLRDNRNGRVLLSRSNFSAAEMFVPSQGLQERLEFGQNAVIRELARDIVSELRSNW